MKSKNLMFFGAFYIWICFGIISSLMAQTVTWLHPTAAGRYELESGTDMPIPLIKVQVTTDNGTVIDSTESLQAAGWEWVNTKMWQNPDRNTLSKRLNVLVSGLLPGRHKIYLQYFDMPLAEDPLGYAYYTSLYSGTDIASMQKALPKEKRLVAGTGGLDFNSIYDGLIGIVGNNNQPTTTVAIGLEKSRWSVLVRYGSIRIESELDVNAPLTLDDTQLNCRVREVLLKNGPTIDGKPVYGMAVVADTLKVRPKSFNAIADVKLSSKVDLAGACGEYANRQILLHCPYKNLENVVLKVSCLTNDKGETINDDSVKISPLGYVLVNVPNISAEHGWWPEPILPFLKEFNVARGDVQSLWYQVHVPRSATPGIYRGDISITPSNAPPIVIPVSFRVWNFAMPLMPYLRVVAGTGKNDDFEMNFGIQPGSIYGYQYDATPDKLTSLPKSGTTAFCLGFVNGPIDPATKKPIIPDQKYLDTLVKTIRTRYDAACKAGLRDACYIYMYDECKVEWTDTMMAVAGRLRSEFPDLLFLTTSPLHGNESLRQVINAWCPAVNGYANSTILGNELRTNGRQYWWYTCNLPPRPFANLFMTQPATAHRQLMGFAAFAYKTDGFLYYTTFGGARVRGLVIKDGPYVNVGRPIADRDTHDWLYLKGPNGFLSTMRMEAIRAGLQDYNYLYIARDIRRKLQSAGLETPELKSMADNFKQYDKIGNSLIKSISVYDKNPDHLDEVKQRLGSYIEMANTVLRQKTAK